MTVVRSLKLGRGEIVAGAVQTPVVVPVGVFEGGDLDVGQAVPRGSWCDDLGLVQADRGLGQGTVESIADGASILPRAGGLARPGVDKPDPQQRAGTQQLRVAAASNRPNALGGEPSGRVLSSGRAKWRCRVRSSGAQPACSRRIAATCAAVRAGVSEQACRAGPLGAYLLFPVVACGHHTRTAALRSRVGVTASPR